MENNLEVIKMDDKTPDSKEVDLFDKTVRRGNRRSSWAVSIFAAIQIHPMYNQILSKADCTHGCKEL